MRVLHEPTPEEVVEARGEYQYLRGGQPTGQVESWSISHTPDGQQIVRADVDGRSIPGGPSLLTHLQRGPQGQATWLRLRYEKPEFSAAAQYEFETAEVKIIRQAYEQPRRQDLLEIAANYVIDYHPVIAHDYVWRGYPATAEGQPWSIPVFSPDLWAAGDEVLSGRALRFMVTPLAAETCRVPAGDYHDALSFQVVLSDGVTAMAWYDDSGIPIRWYYPDKGYDFVLVKHVRQ